MNISYFIGFMFLGSLEFGIHLNTSVSGNMIVVVGLGVTNSSSDEESPWEIFLYMSTWSNSLSVDINNAF